MATDDDLPRVQLRSAMQTDVGMVRDHNEDAAYIDEDGSFFVVADGMGGHAAGEVASAMAVESIRDALSAAREEILTFGKGPNDEGREQLVGVLEAAVREAHRAVYERGVAEPDKQGMGTTLDVVLIAGPEAFIAHVGDSRTYLMREDKVAQITTDHTVAEVLVIEGKLSIEEAQVSPLRTILVNAIGVAPEVGVEMAHVRLRTGDRLLLCSDGLHDYFPTETEIADYLRDREPPKALDEMVEQAKERGGHDNITGVLLEILEAPELSDDELVAGTEPASPDGDMARTDTQPVPVQTGDGGAEIAEIDTQVGASALPENDDSDETENVAEADTDPGTQKEGPDSKPTLQLQVRPDGQVDARPIGGKDGETADDDDNPESDDAESAKDEG